MPLQDRISKTIRVQKPFCVPERAANWSKNVPIAAASFKILFFLTGIIAS
jgi:hypothetical protein